MSNPVAQGGRFDIDVFQGGTFTQTFTCYEADGVTPRPLTGYTTGKAEVRSEPGGDLYAEMAVTVVVGNSTDTPGAVTISMTPAVTVTIPRSGHYDILLIHTNGVDRIYFMQGRVALDRRVTVQP